MLEKEKTIDLVVIMSPSGMRYEHALNIIKKFRKHIVIEKPTCMKTSEVIKLYKLAKNKIKIYCLFYGYSDFEYI